MKLLAISDLHGDEQFLDHLRSHLATNRYDAIFTAGDIEGHSYAEDLLDLLSGIKTFAVPGNMDSKDVIDLLDERNVLIEGRREKLGDWYVAGVGGGLPSPFNTVNERTEEEIREQLNKAKIDEYTILITHAPPYGVMDDPVEGVNIGSKSIRDTILQKKPLLNVCGHVHERQGQKMLGETLVVKLGPAKNMMVAIIEIKDSIDVTFMGI